MKRVHITGCPRSGTTLMMELMRIGFRFDSFCEHEMSIFKQPEGSPDLFLSKKPSDIKRILPLLKADPNLYVIYMVRDPRSVITSIHKNFPGKFFCNFRVWNECDKFARRLVDHPQFIQIRYEELVRSQQTAQTRIHNKFPFLVKFNDFSEYHNLARPSKDAEAALGGVRKISTDKLTTWKNFLPRVKHEVLLHPAMVDILIEKGYEKDDQWALSLETITPEKGECRYPDELPFFKKYESRFRHWMHTRRYIQRIHSNQT